MMEAERLSMTGKMARIVAHEIRNPLTNLNLALEHLKDEMLPASETFRSESIFWKIGTLSDTIFTKASIC